MTTVQELKNTVEMINKKLKEHAKKTKKDKYEQLVLIKYNGTHHLLLEIYENRTDETTWGGGGICTGPYKKLLEYANGMLEGISWLTH